MYRVILVGLAAALLCSCVLYVRSTPHGTTAYVAGPAVRVRPALRPIEQTQVQWSPDYDMYYYDGYWYWYSNGSWYHSSRYDGGWVVVTTLPSVFYDVPQTHPVYVRLPRRERYSPGRPQWTRISRRPTLQVIAGTSIYEATGIGADLFFYGSTWYWYSGGAWYSSRDYNGPWVVISTVPTAFHSIPPGHRKHYVVREQKSPPAKLRETKPTPAAKRVPPKKGESPVKKLREPSTPPTPPSKQPVTPNRPVRPAEPLDRATPVIPREDPAGRAIKRSSPTDRTGKATPATPATPGSHGSRATPATPATPPSKDPKHTTPATPPSKDPKHTTPAAPPSKDPKHTTPAKPLTPPGKEKDPPGLGKDDDKDKGKGPKKDKDEEDEDQKKKEEKEKERRGRGNK